MTKIGGFNSRPGCRRAILRGSGERCKSGEAHREAGSAGVGVLLWLSFVLLVGLAGWLLLKACAIPVLGSLGFANCPSPPKDPIDLSETATLRAELDQIESRLARLRACPAPVAPPAPPPPVEPPPEPAPESQGNPAPEPPQRPQAQLPDSQRPPPEICPVLRTDGVILLVDVSGSMKFSTGLSASIENRMMALENQIRPLVDQARRASNVLEQLFLATQIANLTAQLESLYNQAEQMPGESRLLAAKEAITDLVNASDPDVVFDLVSFSPCRSPKQLGQYPVSQRPDLIRRVRGLRTEDSTALAKAINWLARPLARQPRDKRVNVVLVSDGQDSCGGDPCAAARRLKAQYPNVAINALDLSRSGAARCVAKATDGVFFSAADADDIGRLLRQAAGQDVPEECR